MRARSYLNEEDRATVQLFRRFSLGALHRKKCHGSTDISRFWCRWLRSLHNNLTGIHATGCLRVTGLLAATGTCLRFRAKWKSLARKDPCGKRGGFEHALFRERLLCVLCVASLFSFNHRGYTQRIPSGVLLFRKLPIYREKSRFTLVGLEGSAPVFTHHVKINTTCNAE